MSRTKSPAAVPAKKPAAARRTKKRTEPADVLTLAKAAAYLRVAPEELLRMVETGDLPGRQFGAEWRFLKTALQEWLSTPVSSKEKFWSQQFGALKDDPYLDEIYKRRGRPMTEEG